MTHEELEKIHSEIALLRAETSRLSIESGKFSADMFWYPMAFAVGLVCLVSGMTAMAIRFLS
ncbi:hypothetical protein NS337_08995 [Pseudomonas oryzihabitans]|nr:hypothetical protein NS337_08995 [Pseudomonas psychrotolerans]